MTFDRNLLSVPRRGDGEVKQVIEAIVSPSESQGDIACVDCDGGRLYVGEGSGSSSSRDHEMPPRTDDDEMRVNGNCDFDFENDHGEAAVEMRRQKQMRMPSSDIVAKHRNAGHVPYRPWCVDCIGGMANMDAHYGRDPGPNVVPEFHSDYGFFRDQKSDKVNKVTVLVSKDRNSGGICAHVVPMKGTGGGGIVQQYERDLRKFGRRGKVILRSDGELAIRDLLSKVASLREGETLLEQSPPGDSKANGTAERAIQTVEKHTRTLKIATERRLGVKISVRHPAFPWLVLHASDCYNKFQVHRDGLTTYHRLKGRPYSGLCLELGICVLYKVSVKVQGGVMASRWEVGVWLGKRFGSEEHIIAMEGGKVGRCAAVKEHPEQLWNRTLFDQIRGSPWNPSGVVHEEGPDDLPTRGVELPRCTVEEAQESDEKNKSRDFKILRGYLEEYGYTPGCNKCGAIERGDETQPTLAHDAKCRERIKKKLLEDPVQKQRVLDAGKRKEEKEKRKEEADEAERRSKREKSRRRTRGQGVMKAMLQLLLFLQALVFWQQYSSYSSSSRRSVLQPGHRTGGQ